MVGNASKLDQARERLAQAAKDLALVEEEERQAEIDLGMREKPPEVLVRVKNGSDITGFGELQRKLSDPDKERLDRVKRSTLAALDQAFKAK